MKTWYVAVIAFMSSAMLPITSFAASFDCKKASTSVEKLICTDPKLSELDTDLAQAYRGAVKVSPDVKVGQRQWLKERNACVDVACLANAYQARISELKSLADASGTNGKADSGKNVNSMAAGESSSLPQLIAQLKKSDDPQKYMELSICFESMYQLMTRRDRWALDASELKKIDVVYKANGQFDEAIKRVLSEYCPSGPNPDCYSKLPLNSKGWFSGINKVQEAFSSQQPNRLISGGGAGTNPLVQRNIMVSYCNKFGYPRN